MDTYDVVVVGGGISGGLPAAAYLQKAGLKVAVVEAKPELGNFCPTHETWPETLDSPHAAINFSGSSPAMEDLGLDRYGYRLRTSPVVLGTTHRDGTNGLICYDPERTAENFAKHSQHDGETVFELQSRVLEKITEMNELAFFSPHPDPAKFEQILKLCSYVAGVPMDEMESMTGPELIERLFESDRVRQTVMCPPPCTCRASRWSGARARSPSCSASSTRRESPSAVTRASSTPSRSASWSTAERSSRAARSRRSRSTTAGRGRWSSPTRRLCRGPGSRPGTR